MFVCFYKRLASPLEEAMGMVACGLGGGASLPATHVIDPANHVIGVCFASTGNFAGSRVTLEHASPLEEVRGSGARGLGR